MRVEKVCADEAHLRAVALGVILRRADGLGREVEGRHLRAEQPSRERDGDAPAAGTDVEHPQGRRRAVALYDVLH